MQSIIICYAEFLSHFSSLKSGFMQPKIGFMQLFVDPSPISLLEGLVKDQTLTSFFIEPFPNTPSLTTATFWAHTHSSNTLQSRLKILRGCDCLWCVCSRPGQTFVKEVCSIKNPWKLLPFLFFLIIYLGYFILADLFVKNILNIEFTFLC